MTTAAPGRLLFLCLAVAPALAGQSAEYRQRVDTVRNTPGLVAFWDFVTRDGTGRFTAWQAKGNHHDFALDAVNYVRDYWGEGRAATYDDIPLLGRGPFGQAVRIKREEESDFRPCLLVPRERLHDSGLDVKGPGQSVSMIAWVIRESGNHAIAGIWHEGTDLRDVPSPALRAETGKRQYALFAGLAANNGGAAAHVSENGAQSFGDKYARNLAVTPEIIPAVPESVPEHVPADAWHVVAFSFDNRANTVTAYFDGKATEFWIDDPGKHPFFRWPARAWAQAELRRTPGLQPGEDPAFPASQFYRPPEGKPLSRIVIGESGGERVEVHHFPFTRVRVTLRNGTVVRRELIALKVNPFWFGHDLYAPRNPGEGGSFTIGRVIHTSRSVGFTGYIGGIAVFRRALSAEEMRRLAEVACAGPITAR